MSEQATLDSVTVDELNRWLIDWLAGEMGLARTEVEPGRSFLSYGMDSVQAMTMVGDLESRLGLRLPPTLAWDHPDIESLSSHLATLARPASTKSSAAPNVPTAQPDEESLLAGLDGMSDDEIDRLLTQYSGGSV